jgi:diguanylate cyclase
MAGLLARLSRLPLSGPDERDFKRWIEQHLDLLDAEAAQDRDASGMQMREELNRFRFQIAGPGDREDAERALADTLTAARRHFALRRAAAGEREAGYRGVIGTLTEGLATVAAESGSFAAALTDTSDRVSALAGVGDIRLLKQQLAREVGEIKRVVAEKQQRDQALHATLTRRVQALETSLAQTQVAAALDPLTGVAHRGHFETALQEWVQTARATAKSFVLALIDLDNFKEINDTHGHLAGDAALVGAAQALNGWIGPGDLLARYGGDEFALLLADVTLEAALKRAPALIAAVARAEFADADAPALRLTVSCGLAEWRPLEKIESLMKRADQALYAAKGQGRNRVVAHGLCARPLRDEESEPAAADSPEAEV